MIRILIVDDEMASIRLMKAFLKPAHLDLDISEAENGVAALTIIQSEAKPQIIITDMEMPIMGGIPLLQFLRDCHPEIKVIVASGYFDFNYTHAAIRANVKDYLLKPIDPKQLIRVISECIKEIQEEAQGEIPDMEDTAKAYPHISLPIYKSLLMLCDDLSSLLDYMNLDGINHKLLELKSIWNEVEYKEEFSSLSIKMCRNTLYQYCIKNDIVLTNQETVVTEDELVPDPVQYLSSLYETCLGQIKKKASDQGSNALLVQVHSYIKGNYRQKISLKDIAAKFYINREYLSVLFKQEYQETIGNYIQRLKMDDAKNLLLHSELDVSEISEMLGYDDPAYFSRLFKKKFGMSPNKYRNTMTDSKTV